jgi:hypothetical protein
METKTCSACGQDKPLEQFHRDKISRDGRTHDCAQCRTARAWQWQRDHPEYLEARRERRRVAAAAKPKPILDTTSKRCSLCKQTKPLDQFNRNHHTRDGRHSHCQLCARARVSAWQKKKLAEDPEHIHSRNRRWLDQVRDGKTNRQRMREWHHAQRKQDRIANPEKWAAIDRKKIFRKFGITAEQYDTLVLLQNNRCAICKTNDPGHNGKGRRNGTWSIDHDHQTTKVRGLLCHTCNFALHKFDGDIEWGQKAIAYLQSPPAHSITR